jgi:nitrogen-specific signal transduction histidine kinase
MAMSEENVPGGGEAPREELHRAIRKIAHDLSNPIGVLRMASYFLKTVPNEKEKRDRYLEMVDLNIDRIEQLLKQLRALTETGSPEDDLDGAKDDNS